MHGLANPAVTTIVGILMVLTGLRKNRIDLTRSRKKHLCPSCGRTFRGDLCSCVKKRRGGPLRR